MSGNVGLLNSRICRRGIVRNEKLGSIPAIRSLAETESFVREQYQLYEQLALRIGLRSQ